MNNYDQKRFKKKYKCSLGQGGWCDGTKIGSRMRCPAHSLCPNGDRACIIGIEKDLDEMICDIN